MNATVGEWKRICKEKKEVQIYCAGMTAFQMQKLCTTIQHAQDFTHGTETV